MITVLKERRKGFLLTMWPGVEKCLALNASKQNYKILN